MIEASDIYVLAGLLEADGLGLSRRELGRRLASNHMKVQRAIERLAAADLCDPKSGSPHRGNVETFAAHALRFVAPVDLGPLVTGVPAAWAAEPLVERIASDVEPPPVWPSARGSVRGQALEPLDQAAPEAVQQWPELREQLALFDALRAGDLRVRSVATKLLTDRLRARKR